MDHHKINSATKKADQERKTSIRIECSKIAIIIFAFLLMGCGSHPTITPTIGSTPIPSATAPLPTFTPKIIPSATPRPTLTASPTPAPQVQIVLDWIQAYNDQKLDEALSYWTPDCSMDLGVFGMVYGQESMRAEMEMEFSQKSFLGFVNYALEGDVVTGRLKVFLAGVLGEVDDVKFTFQGDKIQAMILINQTFP
jgi:hypothetical protein